MSDAPFRTVIGLEIHIQLATESQIFSGEAATYGQPPNTATSPVSLAYPGTLPILNRQAVEMALLLGLACGCATSPETKLFLKETGKSRSIRQKETHEGYRYFPEPDMPACCCVHTKAPPIPKLSGLWL